MKAMWMWILIVLAGVVGCTDVNDAELKELRQERTAGEFNVYEEIRRLKGALEYCEFERDTYRQGLTPIGAEPPAKTPIEPATDDTTTEEQIEPKPDYVSPKDLESTNDKEIIECMREDPEWVATVATGKTATKQEKAAEQLAEEFKRATTAYNDCERVMDDYLYSQAEDFAEKDFPTTFKRWTSSQTESHPVAIRLNKYLERRDRVAMEIILYKGECIANMDGDFYGKHLSRFSRARVVISFLEVNRDNGNRAPPGLTTQQLVAAYQRGVREMYRAWDTAVKNSEALPQMAGEDPPIIVSMYLHSDICELTSKKNYERHSSLEIDHYPYDLLPPHGLTTQQLYELNCDDDPRPDKPSGAVEELE